MVQLTIPVDTPAVCLQKPRVCGDDPGGVTARKIGYLGGGPGPHSFATRGVAERVSRLSKIILGVYENA